MVTFRLADSLPKGALLGDTGSPAYRRAVEGRLDAGYGACLLAEPVAADIVETALLHFNGTRYHLYAWVVMPNHVHALFAQVEGERLADIVHSWKSFTANTIHAALGRRGALWAKDYFDRFIRNERHFWAARSYIEANPVKAGLAGAAADWPWSSARRE